MTEPKPKPPLGIQPRRFWLEARLAELYQAVGRRAWSGFQVLPEWLNEITLIERELSANESRFCAAAQANEESNP